MSAKRLFGGGTAKKQLILPVACNHQSSDMWAEYKCIVSMKKKSKMVNWC